MSIVITGLGVIGPTGRGVDVAWKGIVAGEHAARTDERLVEWGVPVTLACPAPEVDADAELGRGTSRRLDRFTHLAAVAAAEAITDAGLRSGDGGGDGDAPPDALSGVDTDRVGIVLGSGIGGGETWSAEYPRFLDKGPRMASPMFVPRMLSNTAAGYVAIRTGARGPNMTVNTACAAGASALHMARDLLVTGQADLMLAGGVEASITPLAVSAFARMGALSSNPDAATASRPFDVDRDGFVMGEGAAVLVLETAEHARARGATPLATLLGAGASADAYHATAPPDDGGGAVLAMRRALADAELTPSDVDHVNAHGTSTPLNDKAETAALHEVFGPDLDDVAVTSTKGVTGHLLGAAGAVEAVWSVLTLRDQVIPPTAGLANQDPELDLDVVTGAARERDVDVVMSDAFGFGGQNAVLLLGRP